MEYFKKILSALEGVKKEMSLDKDDTINSQLNNDNSEVKIYNLILKKLEQKFKHSIHEIYSGNVKGKKITFDTIFIIKVNQNEFDEACYSNFFIKSTAIEMFYNELKPYKDSGCILANYSNFWSFSLVPKDDGGTSVERVQIESCSKDLIKQARESDGSVTLTDIHGNISYVNLLDLNLDLDILADCRDTKTYWITDFNPNLEIGDQIQKSQTNVNNYTSHGVLASMSYKTPSGEEKEIKLYQGVTMFGRGESTSNHFIRLDIQGLMTEHFKIKLEQGMCFIATKFPMLINETQIPMSTYSSDHWLEIDTKIVQLIVGATSIQVLIK